MRLLYGNDFTEHMNKIVKRFQYATDEYWGDKNGFKFRVRIDSFDNTTELSEGSQRIVRTNFTMKVYVTYYQNNLIMNQLIKNLLHQKR